jgi:hypothetical protein
MNSLVVTCTLFATGMTFHLLQAASQSQNLYQSKMTVLLSAAYDSCGT